MASNPNFSFSYSLLTLFTMTMPSKGCSTDVLFQSDVTFNAISFAIALKEVQFKRNIVNREIKSKCPCPLLAIKF